MAPVVTDHELYVLAVGPLQADATDPAHGLARLWRAATACGIDEPVEGSLDPIQLPVPLREDQRLFRLIAQKVDGGMYGAAAAFVAHDVAAVIVRMRAPDSAGEDSGFIGLSSRWRSAIGVDRITGVFGLTHVFTGTTTASTRGAAATHAPEVDRLFAAHHGEDGDVLSCAVAPGIALWDADAPDGRSIVALAEAAHRRTLDEWCWLSATSGGTGRLVRYLTHAVKLRFEFGVYQEGVPHLRDVERRLDAGLDELFALHERFESTGASPAELVDAQSRLSRMRGDAAGLLISMTLLRNLGQTVEIARDNMLMHQPEVIESTTMSPFSRDLSLATWLEQQTRHELVYLESTSTRVTEAQTLTDLRLKERSEAHARTSTWLTVMQTSVLGALLGTLGVATTFGEPFHVSPSERAAIMALTAALTLALPPLAARWTNRYGWADLTAVGVIGAAAGWVVAVTVPGASSLPQAAAIITLAALLLAGLAHLLNGRHRHSTRRS